MAIDRDDPRLRAACLTESEFVGDVNVHPDTDEAILEAYREFAPWREAPIQEMLDPQGGYDLRYDPRPRTSPLVFLSFDNQLVGIFESDTLVVDPDHRGRHLSRELILAGFVQAPWKDIKGRKVTARGEAALRNAHRFCVDIVGRVGEADSTVR